MRAVDCPRVAQTRVDTLGPSLETAAVLQSRGELSLQNLPIKTDAQFAKGGMLQDISLPGSARVNRRLACQSASQDIRFRGEV